MVNIDKSYNVLKISDLNGNETRVLSCLTANDFMNRMRHCFKKGTCPKNIVAFMTKEYRCEIEHTKKFETQSEYFQCKDSVKRSNSDTEVS